MWMGNVRLGSLRDFEEIVGRIVDGLVGNSGSLRVGKTNVDEETAAAHAPWRLQPSLA